ncbi:MAG: hypothetical protein CMM91_11625 [Rickettsiales bacterium]|jgi:hypothetical protein|nr:hypothetical protein [Rickettsiales bacterium]MAI84354.1 hypothetical protein [Rickettsiales bacterium]MAI85556.1 hypothetical protein [Rickettsiales bacterium]OUV53513.1 MAG: hypothetical protein CBC87_04145 [Rickettsiales bacterium TMED127]|tara:strand:+ start:11888 stop:12901 length:1014 start_codon:yes stop_codon:yes gene_type:complete
MAARNFRVNNGLSVGDVAITASSNAVTGISSLTLDNSSAPGSDAVLANKKYVDDQLTAKTSIVSGSNNVTVGASSVTLDIGGTDQLIATNGLVRITGNLTVDGTRTELNTTTLSVEDNMIEVNRNVSSAAGMPSFSGLKANRGATSSATEEDLFWVWDETFADDGTSTFGNASGAWTAYRSDDDLSNKDLVDIRANVVHAQATSAAYADVGERFEADAPMSEGAVVTLGGAAEITESTTDLSDTIFGVISTQPAYRMNALAGNDESHPFVAMTGRTPVRVTGAVSKGQRLVSSSIKGTARAVAEGESINPFHVVGRALEDKTDAGIGLVLAVVRTNN